MASTQLLITLCRSLRSSERGLKFVHSHTSVFSCTVAPFVGAWIEINIGGLCKIINPVAPFVGAWIEML